MRENDLNEFLKKNKSIFSYLKDDNGNRIGVIISTPGENEPKIGYAFFSEVVETFDDMDLYEPILNIGDAPNFMDTLTKYCNCKPNILSNIKLPSGINSKKFRTDKINKKATIHLARQRVNSNRNNFYVTENKKDYQSDSVIYDPNNASNEYIAGNIISRRYSVDRVYTSRTTIPFISCASLRKQIRAFEFRALKYYKYVVPEYKK